MSILDLPPELLLEVISRTVPDSPSLEHKRYLKRTRSLLSFSLVHRQWSRIARAVSMREIWIRNRNHVDGEWERKSRQLVQAKVKGTKYLTVEGDIEALLKETGLERWNGLVYLKNRSIHRSDHSARLDTFARFPNLETLNLSDGIFSFETFDSNLYFPKLRRLVLSLQPVLQGDIEDIQGLLSPAHLPNLTHLALQSPAYFPFGPAQLFGSILPQITTLALSDLTPHYSSSALLELIGRCSNLKHLSLAIESNDIESRLFADAAGMELESLHMSSSAFVNSNTLLSRLAALGKGEPETIKVKRVVIYEEEGRLPAIRPYMADGDVFEWRLNRDVPPFEDFDGR